MRHRIVELTAESLLLLQPVNCTVQEIKVVGSIVLLYDDYGCLVGSMQTNHLPQTTQVVGISNSMLAHADGNACSKAAAFSSQYGVWRNWTGGLDDAWNYTAHSSKTVHPAVGSFRSMLASKKMLGQNWLVCRVDWLSAATLQRLASMQSQYSDSVLFDKQSASDWRWSLVSALQSWSTNSRNETVLSKAIDLAFLAGVESLAKQFEDSKHWLFNAVQNWAANALLHADRRSTSLVEASRLSKFLANCKLRAYDETICWT